MNAFTKKLKIVLILITYFNLSSCNHFKDSNSNPRNSNVNRNTKTYDRHVSNDENFIEDISVPWAYDPGPATSEQSMGEELINLVAQQPYMPGLSLDLTGEQKFRPAFGPTLWRMIQKPNSVKILFIGQDGTHIAEAAGRTATAGFGGRAQDLAAYFGVSTGAAFINTFAFTIRGQYSAYQAPFVIVENGKTKINVGSIVDNGTWTMAQDQNSPMVKWRNNLIDWIIRNNKDSLKMIVSFGGSAQDSIATFIESHGGRVQSRYNEKSIEEKNIKVPFFTIESAGSNKVFPVLRNKKGEDLYSKINGKKLDYKNEADQKIALNFLSTKSNDLIKEMYFENNGLKNSGIIHPAQINGFNLNSIEINNHITLSLKGLKLSDGTELKQDVLVTEFPHPTALSLLTPDQASLKIQTALKQIQPYVQAGWKISPDKGMRNSFAENQKYKYSRTDIPIAFYDFGTPKNRMVSKSDAARMTGKPNIIILGTREKTQFDLNLLKAATDKKPNELIDTKEMFSARPRTQNRFIFDQGPGVKMAKIMKENLNMKQIGKIKSNCQLKSGIVKKKNETIEDVADVDCFNIKTHPIDVADHGHYRGTFKNPKVLILADPTGVDEILTSRALTGTRGQYIHGLMSDLGVNDQYLVIRTVPFGMDKASEEEWATVLKQTENYRSALFAELFKKNKPDIIIADGNHASAEIDRLAPENIPVIKIERKLIDQSFDNDSGLLEALTLINQTSVFSKQAMKVRMSNIPRSHLGFMSRVWEGTSGTRVFNSTTPAANGIAFAVVVPTWVLRQKEVYQTKEDIKSIETLKQNLIKNQIDLLKKNDNIETQKVDDEDDDTNGVFNPNPLLKVGESKIAYEKSNQITF